MFEALGRFTTRRRWWVLIGTLVFMSFAATWGTGVFGSFSSGAGFDDPHSDSARADALLEGPLHRYAPDVVVLYSSPDKTIDDPSYARAVQQAVSSIPAGAAESIASFWSTHDPAFVSGDRHATYVTVRMPAHDDQGRVSQFKTIRDALRADGLQTRFGGVTPMTEQVNRLTNRDIAVAESISIPLLLIFLLFVFRSAVAAIVPLAIGGVVTLGSFAVLRVITSFVDISTFAINVVTMLGLGLAIDYSLLMVTRFREELAGGASIDDAVARTTATAGRTIAYAGVTVAAVIACLLVYPSRFLVSVGYSGVVVVLSAVIGSLTALPAILRFAGHRINALRLPSLGIHNPSPATRRRGRGGWYRVATAVMRRPVLATVGIVIVLLMLGSPILGANWARPAEWVLPAGSDARVVTSTLDHAFAQNPIKVATVVVDGRGTHLAPQDLDDYARDVAAVPGVSGTSIAPADGGPGDLARVVVRYRMDAMSREARDMVHDVRAVPPPPGAETLMTNMPASRVDMVHMVESRLPAMGVAVLVVSFVLMFLAFGSVILPLKSVLFNLLSLSASFGAIKLIFQDGWLSGPLHFLPIGAVDVNFPVLIVAIAFGLAMDYEVFLLSRIREQWERTGSVDESIALGVDRTAGVITSAAMLFVLVVFGFLFSGIVFMKMIGVGLVIAVAVDATIVRGLLVPATMKLLGRHAWWSPPVLARWWARRNRRDRPGVAA
ncbi:MMPL family transporter [Tsukamurella sp. 8F]|uniref:MMPL family transporter n=1 Tax=unclassified Tsukamurella TaxID=2633480 RepID=UPI0023BA10D6|nr:MULTISPECIES: MMPL family transporter [unclassified Tsukamurella]MDF0528460.1 MMPL family transporter [Tsukamurella sp. 8J]MDF0586286.1 MMPL family transporter [Tsukamurella sp. 8F]